MFFQKLFQKPDLLLNAKINLSDNSNFELIYKSKVIGDKELILLALLVFARILRVESSRKAKENLLGFFPEFFSNLKNVDNQKKYIGVMLNIIGFASNTYDYTDSKNIKLKKVQDGNFYLDMGVIKVLELSTVVYTIFNYVWENVEVKENKIRLLEAFTVLSVIYNKEKFTIRSAVDWPNIIVYDTIPFDQPLENPYTF